MSENKKNKKTNFEKPEDRFNEKTSNDLLIEKISDAVKDLYYISETDAAILPFSGKKAREVSKKEILSQTGNSAGEAVETRDFSEFFERLTKIQDWYKEEEIKTARKFTELKKLLEQNLKDLKVFKIGLIELEIYAVGLDSENTLKGIKTKAVET